MIAAGVDTHKNFHILAITNELGKEISHHRIDSGRKGTEETARLLGDPKEVIVIGIEGTGSYGATLTRHLLAAGYRVSEVARPKRPRHRPGTQKNDAKDALRAAREALRDVDEACTPKPKSSWAEACRMLLVAHNRATQARTAHMNAIYGLVISAPDAVREELLDLKGARLVRACAQERKCADMLEQAAWSSLCALAKLWMCADEEAKRTDDAMRKMLQEHAPALIGAFGVGAVNGSAIAAAMGDDPDRFDDEGSFAAAVGASPVEVSSGEKERHRLNMGGDRRANAALHSIALVRMRYDERTKAYVERRTQEGKTKKDIIRCLKRYIAREMYKLLKDPTGTKKDLAA